MCQRCAGDVPCPARVRAGRKAITGSAARAWAVDPCSVLLLTRVGWQLVQTKGLLSATPALNQVGLWGADS